MVNHHSIAPFPIDIDRESFGNWLSGFTDGEGCFQIWTTIENKRWSRAGARFIINLRADDISVLRLIQSFLNCGQVSCRARSDGGNEMARFHVTNLTTLQTSIISHFDKFPLRAKKSRDYEIWRQAVLLYGLVSARPRRYPVGIKRGQYSKWNDDEWQQFRGLVEQLKSIRCFTRNAEDIS